METNQKPKSNKKLEMEYPKTFQDDLLNTMKIFWKAGYSYSKTGRDEDFYTRVLEDLMNSSFRKFLEKYGE